MRIPTEDYNITVDKGNMDAETESLNQKTYSELNNMNHRNITEQDGFHSEGESSGNNNDTNYRSPHVQKLDKYNRKKERTTIIVAIVISLLALIVSIVAIVCYAAALKELKVARENRSKYDITNFLLVSVLWLKLLLKKHY